MGLLGAGGAGGDEGASGLLVSEIEAAILGHLDEIRCGGVSGGGER